MLTTPSVPVFQTGFKKAWEQIRSEIKNIHSPSKCNTCELRPLCHICPASALYECGSYDEIPDYVCELAKASYRLLINDSGDNFE